MYPPQIPHHSLLFYHIKELKAILKTKDFTSIIRTNKKITKIFIFFKKSIDKSKLLWYYIMAFER